MAKKVSKQNPSKSKVIDGEEVISGRKGLVTNPTGEGGTGRKPMEFTDRQLLEAIEGSYGRYATIAATLGVSVNTVKKYIELSEVAADAYDTERELVVDLGEKVVVMAMKSPDPQVALSGASIVLRSKRALARGWNGGNGAQLVGESVERKTVSMQDAQGRMIVLTEEKIMQIESILTQQEE